MSKTVTEVQRILVASVVITDLQVRKYYDEEALMELSQSLLDKGQLQNIIVRPRKKNFFELVLGSRRLKAAQRASEKFIDAAVVRNVSDVEVILLALTENIHRENLTPFEEAYAILKLMNDYKVGIQAIAKGLNRNEEFVRRRLKLLSVPEELQDMVAQRKITVSHVAKLAVVSDENEQKRIAQEVVSNNLNEEELDTYLQQEKLKETKERTNSPPATGKKLALHIDRFVSFVEQIPGQAEEMGQVEIHNLKLALKRLGSATQKVIGKLEE